MHFSKDGKYNNFVIKRKPKDCSFSEHQPHIAGIYRIVYILDSFQRFSIDLHKLKDDDDEGTEHNSVNNLTINFN